MTVTATSTAYNSAGTTSGNTGYKDVTVTVGTNDLIVVFGFTENANGSGTASISTQAGSTSAWTVLSSSNTNNAPGECVGYATASASGSVTVRAMVPKAAGSLFQGATVYVISSGSFTGTPTATAFGINDTDGKVSVTLSASSIVLHGGGDWSAAAPGATATPAGGTVDVSYSDGTHYSAFQAHWTGQASGTRNYGPASPSGSQWIGTVVAIQEAGGGTDATVNAVAATATTAAVAPVVTGIRNASVSAVAATVSVAAVAPVVSSAVNGTVNAVAATATLAAVAPAVSAGASVAAVKATLASAAVAPAIQSGSTVTAVKATATTAAVAPTVAGGASVSAVKANVSTAAVAPAASGGAVVTAVVATVSVAALAPAVSTTSPGTILAVAAHVTVAANAPAVSGGAKVTAVKAALTVAAVAPTVALGATVSAVAATVAVTAHAPSVVTPDARISAVAANLTMQAYSPTVSAVALVYVFRAPSFRMHYIDKEEPIIRRLGIPTAYTILKEAGFYRQVVSATDEEVAAADVAYLGGRDYVLSSSERDALVAAGYGSYIILTEITQ